MSYRFVPAAIDYANSGLGCYIRYKNSGSDRVFVKQHDATYMWLVCPDREIVMVRDANCIDTYAPMGENFDEYIDWNIWNSAMSQALGTQIWMPNYTNYMSCENPKSPNIRRSGRNPKQEEPFILSDSGGFQLWTGLRSFLDPVELVKWYNDNVDWGMILDLPLSIHDPVLIKRSTKVQAKNIDLMLKNKNDRVELINITHGFTAEERLDFLKAVDRPEINRLAFTGYISTIVSSVADMLTILTKARKFKHYHVLGVYNLAQMAVLVKLGNLKGMELLTSDASTPIQSAYNKSYHHQQSIHNTHKRLVIGDRESIPADWKFLPCSCPICSALKYTDILGVLDTGMLTMVLSMHNIYEINRYARMMDGLCRDVSDKEYKNIIKHQLGSRAVETIRGLDLITAYNKDGLDALKKFSIYLNRGSSFRGVGMIEVMPDRAEVVEGEDLASRDFFNVAFSERTPEQLKAGYEALLKRYEGYHKTGKIPPKPPKSVISKQKKVEGEEDAKVKKRINIASGSKIVVSMKVRRKRK
jgi:queuine/archaeosine tRNA-ribosyltransferase